MESESGSLGLCGCYDVDVWNYEGYRRIIFINYQATYNIEEYILSHTICTSALIRARVRNYATLYTRYILTTQIRFEVLQEGA